MVAGEGCQKKTFPVLAHWVAEDRAAPLLNPFGLLWLLDSRSCSCGRRNAASGALRWGRAGAASPGEGLAGPSGKEGHLGRCPGPEALRYISRR